MEVNLSAEMIRVIHDVIARAPVRVLRHVKYGEVDGIEALQLFQELTTELRNLKR